MPLHIANLGSSFAAGPSIPPCVDDAAGRSGANFACLLASRARARCTDLSVSGAQLPNITTDPQDRAGRLFPPQIHGLPPDADVVLVLGGGNDIGYIGGLFEDTLNASWLGSFVLRVRGGVGAPLPTSGTADAPLDVDALAHRYGGVLDAIHAKAPKARVFVVEYLTMLGTHTRPGTDVPFGAERMAHHRAVCGRLLAATGKAVAGREAWAEVVPVGAASEDHAVGSPDPWVSGFTWKLFYAGGAYHPRAEGMRAVADMLYKRLVELGIVDDDGNGDNDGGEL
ncbi:SGNH hydrolase [Daldinia caldariorum]|uniref:SGNH hydrolase n=1 Tax=Daldinia caldariorum TaxID=326644 RepID=UPI002007E660|nr:SGNH hydrolase [Daldinia caldariorum]KAI1465739.1 SGNH hydrolase [Daldinia caldariorum]